MCGICGTLNWGTAVAAATAALVHRGPDAAGAWHDGTCALGFRRLSIIDLTPAGHQPMCSEAGTLWLVFNGEIYNHQALRVELERRGHVFTSRTDSECVLHGFEEWGAQVVQRLRGMFAIALWDQRTRKLFLARDRLGIKPLYYCQAGVRFGFASEIKALLGLPNLDLQPDHSALWDYLTYLYIPTPKTAYRSIRQLPPAHTLEIEADGTQRLACYWKLENWGAPLGTSEPQLHARWLPAVEALREKLREAVQMHLLADVPVGLLLSGGVDSSAVAALACAAGGAQLQTFSIGFDVDAHSELPAARASAAAFGTLHREQVCTQASMAEGLQQMLQLYDQPFADASGMPTLAVARLAAQHVKVVLSGDGGDEIFGGYRWQQLWLDMAAQRAPAALYERVLLPAIVPFARLPRVAGLINRLHLDVRGKHGPERYGALLSKIKSFQKPQLLPELAREFRDYDNYWHWRAHWRADLDLLSQAQSADVHTYLPDDILTKVDRASMAVSLEVRPPLLDHELVELAAGMPAEFRLGKRLLRAAVAALLPPAVLARPKRGFSAPLLHWLRPEMRNGVKLGGVALWAMRVLDAWRAQPAGQPPA